MTGATTATEQLLQEGERFSYAASDNWKARFAALIRADERSKALEDAAALADALKMGRPGHTATHDVILYRGDVGAVIRALKST